MFAEATVCTKILKHEAVEAGRAEVGEDNLIPTSKFSLMKRKRAQLNHKSVPRLGSSGTLVESY